MPQFGRWDEGQEDWPTKNPRYPGDNAIVPAPTAPGDGTPTPPPDYGDFNFPDYGGSGSPSFNFQDVPKFHAPIFNAPSFADAQNEPGYQFRLDAGRGAIDHSAAARGMLRTGGTLKDILEYGQKFGAAEYSNVFNRALQTYGTKYQGARDEYAPYLAQYQNQFGAEQARGMAEFQRMFELYQAQLDAAKFKEALISDAMKVPDPTMPKGGS